MAAPFFEVLKYITNKSKNWEQLTDQEKNSINVWSLNKFISMHRPYVEVVNYVQDYNNLKPKDLYRFYFEILPNKNVFFRYIKSSSKNKINKDLLDILSKYFQCSKRELRQEIGTVLFKKDIIPILKEHNYPEEEIKKLVKDLG